MIALFLLGFILAFVGILFMPRNILGWCIVGSIIIAPLYNFSILQKCSGDCSIRADLILIVPLFLFMVLVWGVKKISKK